MLLPWLIAIVIYIVVVVALGILAIRALSFAVTRSIKFAKVTFGLLIALFVSANGNTLVSGKWLNFAVWAVIVVVIIYALSILPSVDVALRFLCTFFISTLIFMILLALVLGKFLEGKEAWFFLLYSMVVKVVCWVLSIYYTYKEIKAGSYISVTNPIFLGIQRAVASVLIGATVVISVVMNYEYSVDLSTPAAIIIFVVGAVAYYVFDLLVITPKLQETSQFVDSPDNKRGQVIRTWQFFQKARCAHCGKEVMFWERKMLGDGSYICSKCMPKIPYAISNAMKCYTYEQFLDLLDYLEESQTTLSKQFRVTNSFYAIHLDAEHGLFYLDTDSTRVYYKVEEVSEYCLAFVSDEGFVDSYKKYVKGKIQLQLKVDRPAFYLEETLKKTTADTIMTGIETAQVIQPRDLADFSACFEMVRRRKLQNGSGTRSR